MALLFFNHLLMHRFSHLVATQWSNERMACSDKAGITGTALERLELVDSRSIADGLHLKLENRRLNGDKGSMVAGSVCRVDSHCSATRKRPLLTPKPLKSSQSYAAAAAIAGT